MGFKRASRAKNPSATRQVAREAGRVAILEAAERVLGREGFAGTRMADVAVEARVAIGTLYNYFENKRALYAALLALNGERFLSLSDDVLRGVDSPMERLRRLVQAAFEHLERHRAAYATFAEFGGLSEAQYLKMGGAAVAGLHQRYLGLFESAMKQAVRAGAVRADVSPAELTAFLTGAMQAAARAWLSAAEPEPVAGRALLVFDLFMQGAATS